MKFWGFQDQVGAILVEVLQARAGKPVQGAVKDVCLLLLSILEKSLFLNVSVTRSCGLTPHPLRVDDFGKEHRALLSGESTASNLVSQSKCHFKSILFLFFQLINFCCLFAIVLAAFQSHQFLEAPLTSLKRVVALAYPEIS